jgi:hypothetical protein
VRRRGIARSIAIAAALVSGCLEEIDQLDPEVGDPLRPRCVDEDSDPDTDVSFAVDIQAGLFERTDMGCADCHTSGGATPIGLRVSGLDLSSYDSLLDGGLRSGEEIVLPGRPCDSVLVQKVGPAPPFGARMPLDGPPFMDERQLQLLSDWIAEGADEDP